MYPEHYIKALNQELIYVFYTLFGKYCLIKK